MRQRFAKFMYGRSGPDELFRFMSYVTFAPLLASLFIGGRVKSVLLAVTLGLIVLTYYRCFSKKLEARRRENTKYLRLKARAADHFRLRRDMWKQRRDYRFFKCPSCKAVLRVPVGKGKIRVVCKKCGTAFEKKT